MKIPVSHYKKSSKEFFWNGGTLYIKNSKIILKNCFLTVTVFDAQKVEIIVLPDELQYKSIELSDDKSTYILLIKKANYRKLSEILNVC